MEITERINPDDLIYLAEAWQEPLHGIGINWVDIEILLQAIQPISVNEIFENLQKKFKIIQEYTQSRFYRTVSILVDEGFLDAVKDGRKKLVTISKQGLREVGRYVRIMYDNQSSRIKQVIWDHLFSIINEKVGCMLSHKTLVFSSNSDLIDGLTKLCSSCKDFDPSTKPDLTFIEYKGALLTAKSPHYHIAADTIDSWRIPDKSAEIIMLVMTQSSFNKLEIIQEAYRVLEENGYLIIIELNQSANKIINIILNQYYLLELFGNTEGWKLNKHQINLDKVKTKMINTGFKIKLDTTDEMNIIIMGQK